MRESDPGAEKHALLMLAAAMAQALADILPRLVAFAMMLTGGACARFGLYESGPAPRLFRWRYVRTIMHQFRSRVNYNRAQAGQALTMWFAADAFAR